MDCQDSITEGAERRKGQHLGREERGAIQHRKRQVRAGNLDLAVTELPEAGKANATQNVEAPRGQKELRQQHLCAVCNCSASHQGRPRGRR